MKIVAYETYIECEKIKAFRLIMLQLKLSGD
jgi:hypothetical protein